MVEDGALRVVVEGLIDALPVEGVTMPGELLELARRRRVLPVTWHTGGVYVLGPDGKISGLEWDRLDHKLWEDTNALIRNRALFQGARKFDALKPFVPARPPDARNCSHCGGTGTPLEVPTPLRDKSICFCGGLGWLPPGLSASAIAEGDWLSLETPPHRVASPVSPPPPSEDSAEVVPPPAPISESESNRLRSFGGFGWWLVPFLGGVALLVWLAKEVWAGRGGELYRTGWGYKFNPIGGAVLFMGLVLATIVGSIVGWWYTRDERKFDRRYPKRPS